MEPSRSSLLPVLHLLCKPQTTATRIIDSRHYYILVAQVITRRTPEPGRSQHPYPQPTVYRAGELNSPPHRRSPLSVLTRGKVLNPNNSGPSSAAEQLSACPTRSPQPRTADPGGLIHRPESSCQNGAAFLCEPKQTATKTLDALKALLHSRSPGNHKRKIHSERFERCGAQ